MSVRYFNKNVVLISATMPCGALVSESFKRKKHGAGTSQLGADVPVYIRRGVFTFQDEAVEEICGNLLPSDILGQLANSNWKERLAAMEKFRDTVKSMPRSDINCQAFVRAIAKKPGFKETNFQVIST